MIVIKDNFQRYPDKHKNLDKLDKLAKVSR
jgi:hypothetical protein